MADFEQAFAYLLKDEGGFSNEKNDKGGATRWGITRSTLSKWRNQPVSIDEMKNLSQAEAKDIYRAWYWHASGCDKIDHNGIATAMFDVAVVRGVSVPVDYALKICKGVSINQMDPKVFIAEFHTLVVQGFTAIAARNQSQQRFLQGWINRADRLISLA